MIESRDYESFCRLWGGAWETLGRQITERAIEITFHLLADLDLSDIRKAVIAHLQKSTYPPTAADVRSYLGGASGRISADEAWAIASAGEGETIVWTDEIASAARASDAVLPDRIGARRTFITTYERLVREAECQRVAVRWWVSLGTDHGQRETAIRQAIADGRLTESQASQHLITSQKHDAGPIAGLLTGGNGRGDTLAAGDEITANLERLRAIIIEAGSRAEREREKKENERIGEAERARAEEAKKKRRIAAQAEQLSRA